MEAAARSPYQLRRAKRPGTTAAQIDAPAVGIEAAAGGSASRRAKPPPRRRRRTAQIGIPSRRAKTLLRPHHPLLLRPFPNLPHPWWGVRRARSSSPRDLNDDSTNKLPPRPNRAHPWGAVRRARSSPRDLDDDSNKLQPLLLSRPNRDAKRARSPLDLDDSKKLQPLPSPDYRGAKRARSPRDLDDSNKLQPLLSPHYRGVKRARTTNLPCPLENNNWRDWSDLGDGPAGLIAQRVLAYDVADYVRFRAVCCPWRQCSTEPRSHSGLDRRFHPWRWTMLREELAAPDCRCFLNTSTAECVKVSIPELHDHELLAVTPQGLLVLLHDRKHIRLLNPLTRHRTDLPPITTLVPRTDHRSLLEQNPHFINDFAAWGSGVADDSTFVLCFSRLCILGIAKPGDGNWTLLQYHCDGTTSAPLMFAGRFYSPTHNGVVVLENDPDLPRLKLAAKLKNMHVSPIADSVHLVNNCGELMLVHRHRGPLTPGNKSGRWYDTYRVDLDTGTLFPVKSLGGAGRAIFMGMFCSLSVSLDVFPSGSICADTIYMSFDFLERDLLKVGAFHLTDGSVELPCSLVPQPHTLVDCLSLSNSVVDDS